SAALSHDVRHHLEKASPVTVRLLLPDPVDEEKLVERPRSEPRDVAERAIARHDEGSDALLARHVEAMAAKRLEHGDRGRIRLVGDAARTGFARGRNRAARAAPLRPQGR